MTDHAEQPVIYLKRSCPFCLKLRIFLTEAGLSGRFRYVVFDDGDAMHLGLRERMKAAGQEASFPAAEFTPGKLDTGTDDLIARIGEQAGVDPGDMPLLAYYSNGVFPAYGKMFRELREMKSAAPTRPA